MISTIHPFPARMAPELALETLDDLLPNSVVLDPMSGSGTVVRQAAEMGHKPIGIDMDPLAVLMGSVWNTYVPDEVIAGVASTILKEAKSLKASAIRLPWIDEDKETRAFVDYWFGAEQQKDLRRIAYVLDEYQQRNFSLPKHHAADVVRIALSRIIVSKEQGASLARDTSHSRPHKVAQESDYDVMQGLERSILQVRKRLEAHPPWGSATVSLGDARSMTGVGNSSVDAVITSPPYLNAIDYMRGHRLSLIWLGYGLNELRSVRSHSIGAERGPDGKSSSEFEKIVRAMNCDGGLPSRYLLMIERYAEDVYRMLSEISRVLRVGGVATFVVGNSCLKGSFIKNTAAVQAAAEMLGLRESRVYERELPSSSRYLPITKMGTLGKRMRTETILTFQRI